MSISHEFDKLLNTDDNEEYVSRCATWMKQVSYMLQLKQTYNEEVGRNTKSIQEAENSITREELSVCSLKNYLASGQKEVKKAKEDLYNLEKRLANIHEASSNCRQIVSKMGKYREEWTKQVKECNNRSKTWMGDLILAAAFVSFAGPLAKKVRNRCWKEWNKLLNSMSLETTHSVLVAETNEDTKTSHGFTDASRFRIMERFLDHPPFHPLHSASEMEHQSTRSRYDHIMENAYIHFNCPSNTIVVADPGSFYKHYWSAIHKVCAHIDKSGKLYGKSIQNIDISFVQSLPPAGNACWHQSTVISVDTSQYVNVG